MKDRIVRGWIVLAALASPAGAQVPPMMGAPAWALLQGNTIAGSTADGPYAEFFLPDGTAIHADSGGREAGHWTLRQDTVCFSYPADADDEVECRKLEVEGPHGVFIDSDGSRYAFDILPGDARALR